MKFLILLCLSFLFLNSNVISQSFWPQDYREALWMSTRFYGGQRNGEGPNWLLINHRYPVSFVKDADGQYDLTGAWFDCGDHVTFGQTFFYSVYALLKAFDAYPAGFEDRYSWDYSGFVQSGDWSFNGGTPNGIPDVLDEVRYVIDFVMKAVRNENRFYYQIGDANYDHLQWITSGYMATLPIEEGGEREGSRPVFYTTDSGKCMASLAAASLALFSIKYRRYDSQLADSALTKAHQAYNFARRVSGSLPSANGDYYPEKRESSIDADFVSAAIEMYRATGDESFLSEIESITVQPNYWALCYNNTNDIALYNLARFTDNVRAKNNLITTVEGTYGALEVELFDGANANWGPLRYNAGAAYGAALLASLDETDAYDDFIFNQIDYILGINNANLSFLVGFERPRRGIQHVKLPHHRNYFNNDSNVPDDLKYRLERLVPEKNKYFGSLVGGSRDASSYNDDILNFRGSEGGIDYNTGMVGALAYITAKLDPADTITFSVKESVSQIDDIIIDIFPNPFNPITNISLNVIDVNSVESVSIYNVKGERVHSFDLSNISVGVNMLTFDGSNKSSGVYFFKVGLKNEQLSKKMVLIK